MPTTNNTTNIHWKMRKRKLCICNFCSQISLYSEVANLGHTYKPIESDWIELCPSCHRFLDIKGNLSQIFRSMRPKTLRESMKQMKITSKF